MSDSNRTPKTVAFYTLGCKVNQYDTEAMKEAFVERGYDIKDYDEGAHVFVINTCTVTGRGDAKSRQAVRKAKRQNPQAVVAVTGCYSQVDPDAVASIPGVDVVAGTNLGAKIVDLVEQAHDEKVISLERATGWPHIAHFEGRTRAVLKVQEGCEQYCSYCIVPRARGGLRSRDAQDVIDQISRLVAVGFKEVVLTGVHIGAYGKETPGAPRLSDLVRMVSEVSGLKRLRLSSIEPIDLSDDLFTALRSANAFCEHLHMPVQSGSDTVLHAMNRPYTTSEYSQLVDRARSLFPNIAITTDVIVGFPGETPEQHDETVAFIRETEFSRLHVFKFSVRKGTRAAQMPDRVSPQEMARRSEEIISLGKELMLRFHGRFVGQELATLVEESSRPPGLVGLSRNYIRTECSGERSHINQIVRVFVESASTDGCRGHLVGSPLEP